MLTYRIENMTCDHCAATVTNVIRAVDADAKVQVDLARRLVVVEQAKAESGELARAITEAGYNPVRLGQSLAVKEPTKSTGCCGCCA
jgi:copper chaperone